MKYKISLSFHFCSLTTGSQFLGSANITHPASLQMVQSFNKQQVMLPDRKGILKPHSVMPNTLKQMQSIVKADEAMQAAAVFQQGPSAPTQLHAVPTTSLDSLPSTTSLHSSTASLGSVSSHASCNVDR